METRTSEDEDKSFRITCTEVPGVHPDYVEGQADAVVWSRDASYAQVMSVLDVLLGTTPGAPR